jgi:hypothetical protein
MANKTITVPVSLLERCLSALMIQPINQAFTDFESKEKVIDSSFTTQGAITRVRVKRELRRHLNRINRKSVLVRVPSVAKKSP